jgi:hypothetical protein
MSSAVPRSLLVLLLLASPLAPMAVLAQGAGPSATGEATPLAGEESGWQDTITAQVEAFRNRDAPAAFSYAALGFQAIFPTAEAFFQSIIGSGYAPIMESRSHSFGAFQKLSDTVVNQEVRFVGLDQSLYSAIYQLGREEEGWRVRAVQLSQAQGMGI